MTKVKVKVEHDNITKHGRQIGIILLETDNEVINAFLKIPHTINKTYSISTTLREIRKDMKEEIKSLVDSAEKIISTNKLVGKELTFNV